MTASHLWTSIAVALTAACVTGAAQAATFTPRAIAPEAGVETFDKDVANSNLEKDLFANPYASVVVGNVDLYDKFPYVEARYFMVVSDPQWDRLLYSEMGSNQLHAFSGAEAACGALDEPRGLAVDPEGRLYICDTGNNRVLVLQTRQEYGTLTMEPVDVLENLSRPYDVAYSDAGTPFEHGDDKLYVAEAGENRVARMVRAGDQFELTDRIGRLGSGDGCFAGPMAITVGRDRGGNTADVLVADAHNHRLVSLRDTGSELEWAGATEHGDHVVTSLETDHWGNVYATTPLQSRVTKYSPSLGKVADLSVGVTRPRDFHVPFVNIHDHRTGTTTRAGESAGLMVEEWGRSSGLRLYSLGVEVNDVRVDAEDGVTAEFRLTDAAYVTAEVRDSQTGVLVARHEDVFLPAGDGRVEIDSEHVLEDLLDGDYQMTVRARSTYEDGGEAAGSADFALSGGSVHVLSNRAMLLGSSPNPFRPATSVRFRVPDGGLRDARLEVFDTSGRLVRAIEAGPVGPGFAEIPWDGRDRRGNDVSSGVYYYRLKVGPDEMQGQVVRIR